MEKTESRELHIINQSEQHALKALYQPPKNLLSLKSAFTLIKIL